MLRIFSLKRKPSFRLLAILQEITLFILLLSIALLPQLIIKTRNIFLWVVICCIVAISLTYRKELVQKFEKLITFEWAKHLEKMETIDSYYSKSKVNFYMSFFKQRKDMCKVPCEEEILGQYEEYKAYERKSEMSKERAIINLVFIFIIGFVTLYHLAIPPFFEKWIVLPLVVLELLVACEPHKTIGLKKFLNDGGNVAIIALITVLLLLLNYEMSAFINMITAYLTLSLFVYMIGRLWDARQKELENCIHRDTLKDKVREFENDGEVARAWCVYLPPCEADDTEEKE